MTVKPNTVPRMPPRRRRPDSQGWAATLWVLAFSAALVALLIWDGTRS